jgi:hypothetical protein
MKKICLFLILIPALVGSGCDVISENDRIIEMDEVIPLKKVLLLDFTDQDCVNCLRATEETKRLQADYGQDLVVVSIHASLYRKFPLVTDEGNEYEKQFEIDKVGHPTGIIDGTSKSSNPQEWGALVMNRFNVASSLNLALSLNYNADNREVEVVSNITGLKAFSNVKLLLWVIENNIIDWQKMLDNSRNPDYVHNHVLRAAINGTWGEAFLMEEKKEIKNSYLINEKWKPEDISIVGFVYDASSNEVLDVAEVSLLNE